MAAFDLELALERVGGDKELLREIVGLFFGECREVLPALRSAVAAGDAAAVHRHAHALKGSLATLGAEGVSQLALRLEMMGRTENMSDAGRALAELEESIAQLRPELEAFASMPA